MIRNRFGLRDDPFSVTTDERFFYFSKDHEAAFDGILLAIMARKRLILLTGEEGVGKTALLTKLVSHVAADGSLVLAVTAVPGMAVEDLVLAAGGGLTGEDGSPAADLDTVVERIEARMEQTGAGLLAVDNAHDLDRAALRDLVDLVQTETEETGRFLQVLLAGSPGLENRFAADPTLDSAIRRFGARCRLEPLREADVMALIHHRLRVAGGRNDLFEPETIERVAWLSGGLPGRILPLCAAALITAQERDQDTVGPNMVPALSAGGAPINAEPDPLPSYQEAAAYQEVPAASFRPIEPPREPPGQGPTARPHRRGRAGRWMVAAGLAALLIGGTAGALSREGALVQIREIISGVINSAQAIRFTKPDPVPEVATPAEPEETPVALAGPTEEPEPAPRTVTSPSPIPLPARIEAEAPSPPVEQTAPPPPPLAAVEPPLLPPAAAPEPWTPMPVIPSPPLLLQPEPVRNEAAEEEARKAEERARQAEGLVGRAERQIAARRLTTPAGDNAFDTLKTLRAMVPDHPAAPTILQGIKTSYLRMANVAESQGRWDDARKYYERAREVDPTDPVLRDKLQGLDMRQRMAEVAAEPPLPPPEPGPTPPVDLRSPPTETNTAPADVLSGSTMDANTPDGGVGGIAFSSREAMLSAFRQPDVLRAVLATGRDFNRRLPDGKTPLMVAAEGGHVEAVRLLLQNGADAGAHSPDGATALMYGAWSGDGEIIASLIEAGADPNATNVDGKSALMAAAMLGHSAAVRALLDRGAGVDTTTSQGWTALMYAAQAGHTDMVRLLLAHGGDRNALTQDGQSALSLAAGRGNREIVDLLQQP